MFALVQSAPFMLPAVAHPDGEPACLAAHFLWDNLSTGASGQRNADTNCVLSGH